MPIVYPQNITMFNVQGIDDIGKKSFFNKFLEAVDGSFCSYEQQANGTHGWKPQCGVFQPTNVISFTWGISEDQDSPYWQERQCNEFLKLGLQGVSLFFSSGDYGASIRSHPPYGVNPCVFDHDRVFMPTFPPACP